MSLLRKEVVIFKDLDGKKIYVGDTVFNSKGQKAKLKFGYYTHHIKNLSSPAFGFYFDGDNKFYFSEHILKNKKLKVKVKKGD
jgi:hypothetical protein